MLQPSPRLNAEQRELLSLFDALDPGRRGSLLDFARFLARQAEPDGPAGTQPPAEPLGLARPENETVVAAIRRLSQNYPMLEKDALLHQSAALMTAHLMHGRDAESVIDELETLFAEAYRAYRERA